MRVYYRFIRHLLIGLISISVIFGLVVVIYESSQFYRDNLSYFVPNEVDIYVHWQRSFPLSSSEVITKQLSKHFPGIDQWQSEFAKLKYLPWQELAWFYDKDEAVGGWLILVDSSTFSLPDNFVYLEELDRFPGKIVAVSSETAADYILASVGSNTNNLHKFIQGKVGKARVDNYLFISDKLNLTQEINFFDSSLERGDWLVLFDDNYLYWQRLSDQRPRFSWWVKKWGIPQWIKAFVNSSLLVYNLPAERLVEILTYAESDIDTWQTRWRNKYGISLSKTLSIFGSIDLAVVKQRDSNIWQRGFWRQDSFSWLARLKWGKEQQQMLDRLISVELGYLYPTLTTVTLPDGSQAEVFKAEPKDFDYQLFTYQQKRGQIIYFDDKSYVFILPISSQVVLVGNDTLLLDNFYQPMNFSSVECGLNKGKIEQGFWQKGLWTSVKSDFFAIFEVKQGEKGDFIICF